jgi:two-component sensor histidine kinase
MQFNFLSYVLFSVLLSIGMNPIQAQNQANYSLSNQIQDFLILNQTDSVQKYLNKLGNQKDKTFYKQFIQHEGKPNYQSYIDLIRRLSGRFSGTEYKSVYSFIKNKVAAPDTFSYGYTTLYYQITVDLRNNGLLELATQENESLRQYILQFPQSNLKVKKAELRTLIHPIVMHLIQQEREAGIELVTHLEQEAKAINDTDLWIGAMYHHADFKHSPQYIDEYIKLSEQCWKLDKDRTRKSPYYVANFEHLLPVYAYHGGYEREIWYLLTEIYHYKGYANEALYYHLLILGYIKPKSLLVDSILNRYNMPNLSAFCSFADSSGSTYLDPQTKMNQYQDIISALSRHKKPDEALRYASQLLQKTRDFFSENMATELSNYKAERMKMAKELEIKSEKEKSELYSTAAVIVSILLMLVIAGFYLSFRNGRALKKQKQEVEKQRNEIAERDKEKELLLKEIHHRVKNNFQMVSSLLEMQIRDIEDDKAKELAVDGQYRVKSMSLIHQRLYQNSDLKVNIEEYIQDLVSEISAIYDFDGQVKTALNIAHAQFDVDTAIPLGLILNELITNAFKYGMQNDQKTLEVNLVADTDKAYSLSVSDNGKGVPDMVSIQNSKSLGLKLVRRLTKQLRGNMEYSFENGARFTVNFFDK